MTAKVCGVCGRKLITTEEINEGICEDCQEDDEMNNLASAILWTDDIEPNL